MRRADEPRWLTNAYSPEWFSLFLHRISADQTVREVDFVEQHLEPGSLVLDLPCGSGRHAQVLAVRGHRVLAIDRNASVLGSSSGPSWVCADMLALPLATGCVDAIICLWQSFGYFGAAENAALLRQWAELVRPGGRLMLDLYHRGFFEAHQGERWMEDSRGRVRETRTMEGERLIVELSYEGLGGGDRFDWQLFTPEDLEQLASSCGWQLCLACAGFDPRQSPSAQQPRVQYVLRKPLA